MKIKKEHYDFMKEKLAEYWSTHKEAVQAHESRLKLLKEYCQGEDSQGDIDKRIRWDICNATRLTSWMCDNVYSYADDTHIDAALRKIMRELRLPYY